MRLRALKEVFRSATFRSMKPKERRSELFLECFLYSNPLTARKQIKKTGCVIFGGSLLNMKGESAKVCKWKAVFKIVPDGVVVQDVKDLPEVRLVTQVGNNKYITSIEITTSDLSFVDAIAYSELLATEIGPPGIVKEGHAFLTLDTLLATPQYVDITTASFSDILQNRNLRLARQLHIIDAESPLQI